MISMLYQRGFILLIAIALGTLAILTLIKVNSASMYISNEFRIVQEYVRDIAMSGQPGNDGLLSPSLEPDSWKSVYPNESYVYSAHLDPQSNESCSWITILGVLRDSRLKDFWRKKANDTYYCKVWYKSHGKNTNVVVSSPVECIHLSSGYETYVNTVR
jgi:hypothetical protein